MNRLLTVLLFAATLSLPAFAIEQDKTLEPVYQFVDAMNHGDLELALAACGEEMTIIDNVAPYAWHGTEACAHWASAQERDAELRGMTGVSFEIGEIAHFATSGEDAYAVLAASYTFMQNETAGRVEGTFTATLHKGPGGWRMSGFTFSQR